MRNEILDKLVESGQISSYQYDELGDDGAQAKKSHSRNVQKLTIEFNSGDKLVLQTFCSGSAQDTIFVITSKEEFSKLCKLPTEH